MAKGIKTGGRQKGTPNKLTREIRSLLKDIVYQEIENLPDTLSRLEPKERAELLVKILAYTLPKVNAESYTLSEGGATDWDW